MGDHELKTNTACIIPVGPFFDKGDGVSLETDLTITNERITLIAETDEGSAPTLILDNVTGAVSGTDNDLNYIANNDAGMMQIELSASNLNRYGKMILIITDAANHVPVFEHIQVVSAQYWDGKYGTGNFSVNVKAISDDTTAADNCELDYDGTGYAGGTIKKEADLVTIHGTALTETAGQLAAGFKKVFDVATPVFTAESVNQTGDAYAKVDTEIGTMQGNVTDILADTAEIQAELADGGRSDLILDGIAAKTTNIPASPAAVGSAMTLADDAITAGKYDESTAFPLKATDSSTTILARKGDKMDIVDAPGATGLAAVADAILTRNWASVSYTGTVRCVLTALQPLRNLWTLTTGAGGVVVKKEDDATTSWTGTATVDGDGNVSGVDPDS